MISAWWRFGLIHLALLVSTRSSSGNETKQGAFPRFEHSLVGPYKTEEKMLVIEGDIKLGVILSVHEHDEMKPCGDRLRETGAVQFVEGIVFAVHNVNTFIQHMLPFNLTLGAVIVDDCAKPVTALTRALHFLPANQYPDQQCYDTCSRKQDSGRTSLRLEDVNRLTFHDVVGVIGAESSPSSMMVAQLLGSFEIPQISPSASSDLLSDKRKYPYFMRMSPPNHYQVKAMSHLIRHFNWTYVAAVYSKGGYGESGVDGLKAHAARDSVCIGAALAISQHASDDDVNMLVTKLVESNAKVVVLFTDQEETRHLLTVIKSQNLIGRFVLVGSDGVGINLDDLDGLEDAALGVLTLKTYSVDVPEFFNYFESLKPCSDTKNPWFVEMWEELFNTTDVTLCDPQTSIKDADDYSPESTVSLVMDTVYVFADAIGRLVRDHCPNAQPGGAELRSCLRGPLLLQYLHNTSFTGNNGEVRFDSNGDIRGRYEVMNYQRLPTGGYDAVSVAVWDTVTETLNINDSLIVWNIRGLEPGAVPESRCGDQCDAGEVYSYFKDTCCWECRKCGPNEITAYNATRCISCPMYQWPNAVNFTSCEPIPPTSMSWHDPMVLLLASLSAVCICYCCTVCLIYIRHNSDRLIKATSRELSYFMWTGVLMQYLLLFSIVCKPDVFVCYISYTGFNVSFAVVYAPLLTRTNRIYRLFNGGKKGKGLPSLTSPLSQVIIASILVAVQIAINVIVVIASPPEVAHRMPVATEPYVELACDVSMQGFMTSLLYNVLLVVICTYYAFKTRTLPDNFNESRYITLCVYTTLVIWLAFVPSYFTTARAHHQAIVLSSALLLNASVTLLCLYTPKIYAVYTGQAAINFKYNMNTFGGGNGGSVAGHLHISKSVPNLERPSLQHAPVQADFASDPLVQESSDTNGTSVMSQSVAGTRHNSDCSHVTLTEM